MEYQDDIGMYVINRGPSSCKWKTEFCLKNCYNNKLYRAFGFTMKPKDIKNDIEWEYFDGYKVKIILSNKKYNARIRLTARGEAFSSFSDIDKVKDILIKNPKTLIWIPTRSWRSELRKRVKELSEIENARILASIDPSNTKKEVDELINEGWSTLYFGDDSATEDRFLCPKTWEKKKKACYTCEGGCFSDSRVDIHLKRH